MTSESGGELWPAGGAARGGEARGWGGVGSRAGCAGLAGAGAGPGPEPRAGNPAAREGGGPLGAQLLPGSGGAPRPAGLRFPARVTSGGGCPSRGLGTLRGRRLREGAPILSPSSPRLPRPRPGWGWGGGSPEAWRKEGPSQHARARGGGGDVRTGRLDGEPAPARPGSARIKWRRRAVAFCLRGELKGGGRAERPPGLLVASTRGPNAPAGSGSRTRRPGAAAPFEPHAGQGGGGAAGSGRGGRRPAPPHTPRRPPDPDRPPGRLRPDRREPGPPESDLFPRGEGRAARWGRMDWGMRGKLQLSPQLMAKAGPDACHLRGTPHLEGHWFAGTSGPWSCV